MLTGRTCRTQCVWKVNSQTALSFFPHYHKEICVYNTHNINGSLIIAGFLSIYSRSQIKFDVCLSDQFKWRLRTSVEMTLSSNCMHLYSNTGWMEWKTKDQTGSKGKNIPLFWKELKKKIKHLHKGAHCICLLMSFYLYLWDGQGVPEKNPSHFFTTRGCGQWSFIHPVISEQGI